MKQVKFILVALLVIPTSIFSKEYHIDNLVALEKAIKALKDYDKLYIYPSDDVFYTLNKPIKIRNKNNILIQGYAPYPPIIDGKKVINSVNGYNHKPTTHAGLFDINGSTNITIRNIIIKNSNFAGFFVKNSSGIIIEKSFTNNTYSSGIGVWNSNNIKITHNKVVKACNGGEQECITLSNTSNSIVSYNEVSHNGRTVSVESNVSNSYGGEGIDIKQGSHNIVVKHNNVHDISHRSGIYIDAWNSEMYDINVSDNNISKTGNSGITVASECGSDIWSIIISKNDISENSKSGIEIGGYINTAKDYNNNYVCGVKPEKPALMSNIIIDGNLISNNGGNEGNEWLGYGGIDINSPNIEYIYIGWNTLISNATANAYALGLKDIVGQDDVLQNDSQFIFGYHQLTNINVRDSYEFIPILIQENVNNPNSISAEIEYNTFQ